MKLTWSAAISHSPQLIMGTRIELVLPIDLQFTPTEPTTP